jgi:hypothetical protein
MDQNCDIERARRATNFRARSYSRTVKGTARKLLRSAVKRAEKKGLPCTIVQQDLIPLIEAALAAGHVTLSGGPRQASLDQRIAGAGYVLPNLRIVPAWFNYARHRWDDDELYSAMRKAGYRIGARF